MTRLIIQRTKEAAGAAAKTEENSARLTSWLQALSPNLRELTICSVGPMLQELEEIRLRIGRPIIFRIGLQEFTADQEGRSSASLEKGCIVTRQDLERTLQVLSQSSLYAWEDDLRHGFITIPGGHRVGITGRGVLDKGRIRTLKDISGLNYRIGREILGCSEKILPYLISEGRVMHGLIISAPQCGKTTLLRDLVRQISNGNSSYSLAGVNVGLVDERSEIAGMYLGEPQYDLGLRTDILDACPKAEGMMMLIRSMSPQVIATDEIGRQEDMEAINHALQAGVTVITTVHGASFEEIQRRPVLGELLQGKFFDRLIFLSRRKGPGTLEAVLHGKTLEKVKIC